MIDSETIRIIITGCIGLLGTFVGGFLNCLMTNSQVKKEESLEKLKYENDRKIKEEAEKKESIEKRKKLYSEYIDVATSYASKKDNIDELRKKTIDVILQGGEDVVKAVSKYYSDINDELNRMPEFASIKYDENINKVINAVRKEILGVEDDIYVHLVDNDRYYENNHKHNN